MDRKGLARGRPAFGGSGSKDHDARELRVGKVKLHAELAPRPEGLVVLGQGLGSRSGQGGEAGAQFGLLGIDDSTLGGEGLKRSDCGRGFHRVTHQDGDPGGPLPGCGSVPSVDVGGADSLAVRDPIVPAEHRLDDSRDPIPRDVLRVRNSLEQRLALDPQADHRLLVAAHGRDCVLEPQELDRREWSQIDIVELGSGRVHRDPISSHEVSPGEPEGHAPDSGSVSEPLRDGQRLTDDTLVRHRIIVFEGNRQVVPTAQRNQRKPVGIRELDGTGKGGAPFARPHVLEDRTLGDERVHQRVQDIVALSEGDGPIGELERPISVAFEVEGACKGCRHHCGNWTLRVAGDGRHRGLELGDILADHSQRNQGTCQPRDDASLVRPRPLGGMPCGGRFKKLTGLAPGATRECCLARSLPQRSLFRFAGRDDQRLLEEPHRLFGSIES